MLVDAPFRSNVMSGARGVLGWVVYASLTTKADGELKSCCAGVGVVEEVMLG
jgi:hypothetical protein